MRLRCDAARDSVCHSPSFGATITDIKVHTDWSCLPMSIVFGMIFTFVVRSFRMRRDQAVLLVVGTLPPILATIPSMFGVVPSARGLNPHDPDGFVAPVHQAQPAEGDR